LPRNPQKHFEKCIESLSDVCDGDGVEIEIEPSSGPFDLVLAIPFGT
jgi:hypothetical protein